MNPKFLLATGLTFGVAFLAHADDIVVTGHDGRVITHDIGGHYQSGRQVYDQNNVNVTSNLPLNGSASESHPYAINFPSATGSAILSSSASNSYSALEGVYSAGFGLSNQIDLQIAGLNQFYYSQANASDTLLFSTTSGVKLDITWTGTADNNALDSYLNLSNVTTGNGSDLRKGIASGKVTLLLAPGDYELLSGMDTSLGSDTRFGGVNALKDSTSGTFSYAAKFTPVPEPASVIALSAGLVALVRRRKHG